MKFTENDLSYEDYRRLRESVGWQNFSEEQTRGALEKSLYTVAAVEDDQTVGMGRLTGDGLYNTIVDIVVNPLYQKRGIGSTIIDMLLEYAENKTPVGGRSCVWLIAEKGTEMFYIKKGFKLIPHEFCGSGMRRIVRK